MNRKKSFWTILASVICACATGVFFLSREHAEGQPDKGTESVSVAGKNSTLPAKNLNGVAAVSDQRNSDGNDPTELRREMRRPDFSRQLAWLENGELPAQGEVFPIEFFDDKTFPFRVDKAEKLSVNGKEIISVSGRTREDGLLVATCVVADGKVFASVNDFERARVYSIAYDFQKGAYFSSECDQSKELPCGSCGNGHKNHVNAVSSDAPVLSSGEVSTLRTQVASADDASAQHILDILIIYDKTGYNYANSNGGTDAIAASAIVRMNACFTNSGINAAYRLAGVEVLENYESDGDFDNALNYITSDAEVAKLREFYGADLVQLYHTGSEYSGLAWVGPRKGSMFSVVGVNVAKNSDTTAHEAGHNLGCRHSRNQTQSPGTHEYAVGTNNTTTPGNTLMNGHPVYYNTVMSYSVSFDDPEYPGTLASTTRAPIFSGPNSVWDGVQLGSATEDNCRMLNESILDAVDYYTPGPFDVSEVAFGKDGGTENIDLKADFEWTAEIGGASWLTVSPTEGTTGGVLTLQAEANPYCVPRSGTLTVALREVSFTLPVKQEPADAVMKILDVSGNEVSEWTDIVKEGGTYEFSLETNWPSLLVSTPDWMKATLNMTAKKLTVVVSENKTLDTREGDLKLFYSGDKTNPVGTLKVAQAQGEPFLIVYDGADVELGKSEGRKNIYVDSNVEWTVSAEENIDWLTVSNNSSTESTVGGGYILLSYDENTLTTVRRTTLTFIFADRDGNMVNTQTVAVAQKASPPFVVLEKESLLFNYGAGSQAFELRANTDWTLASTLPDWITLSASSGAAGTHALTLSVKQNSNAFEGRSATLFFNAGGKTAKLSVSQGLMQTISAEISKVLFSADGGTREIKLYSNGIWKAVYWPEWVSITPKSGNAPTDGILTITLKPLSANTGASARSGWLTLECGESRLSILLEQQHSYSQPEPENSGIPEFGMLDFADPSEYLYLAAEGEERCVALGFEVGEAEIVFTLDPEWLACELDAETPSDLWLQAIPNEDGELRETWVFVLMKDGNLHAIPVKQAEH